MTELISTELWAQIITIGIGILAGVFGRHYQKLRSVTSLISDIDAAMKDGQVSDSELQAIIDSAKKVAGIKPSNS